jgi:hypothetical protein
MTTALAVVVIVTAVSLITGSSGSGLVTSAFAVKKGDKSDPSSSGSSTGPRRVKKIIIWYKRHQHRFKKQVHQMCYRNIKSFKS